MTYSFSSPSSFRRSTWGVVGAILSAAVAFPAAAQVCPKSCAFQSCGTPAIAVPASVWGDLESAEPQAQVFGDRDSTEYQEFGKGHTENSFDWFSSVDVENGTVFTSTGYGVIAWRHDANGGLQAQDEVGMSAFPQRAGGELSLPIQDVDAPTGSDDVVAVSGFGAFGMALIDSRNLGQMKVLYQDKGQDASEVYATEIGGVKYAFLATSQGVKMYDLTAALKLTVGCAEETSNNSIQCPGIYKRTIGHSGAQYVDGTGDFVVISYGRGFEVWNVGNPASPQLRLSALGDRSVFGIALWQDGGKHYVGLVTTGVFVPGVGQGYDGHTYDVSCITGTCGALGGPLDTFSVGEASVRSFVTFSRAGNRPFLYFGNENRCVGGRGYLMDVSNPANAFDVSPPGYWESTRHMNRLWSGRGKFAGEIFYRAANSVLDMHRLSGGAPPNATMAFPSEIYAGIPAAFSDSSIGLVETRSWTFQGGTPSSSSLPVVPVTFGMPPGPRQVTLTVGNGAGSDSDVKTVTVLDPTPAIAGVGHSPALPQECQQVTLDADATGPNLTYAWTIVGPNEVTITGSGDPLVLTAAQLPAPGAYTATVVASNGLGLPATSLPHPFTIDPLQALPAQGFAISHGPLDTGSVTLNIDAIDGGAAEWQWDFDADQNPSTVVWGSSIVDPAKGPVQTRTFGGGTFTVRARVRNCQSAPGAWVESAPLQLTIVNPLVANFAATGIFCDGGECGASTNQAISFRDTSTGDPETWFYAWNNTSPTACTGYDAGHDAPVPSHTYTSAGFFFPCLKVQRGTASDELIHGTGIRVTAPGGGGGDEPTPRITVTGPVSGQPGTAYNFTASASNCVPTANGWTWTTSGGAIDGASNGTSISVSWSTAGSKSVSARNSACGSAFGSRSITISSGPGGGGDGTVVPQFSIAPVAPRAGQSVTFNAAATSGSVDGYSWTFGDGTTGIGQQVSHTYAAPGTYSVELSVGVAGCGISPTCFKSLAKNVVVVPGGGGGDPDPDPDPGGGLAADFTFTPAAPRPGEPVSFDGGISTGSPVDFTWGFGDGGTGTGSAVSHAFATEGDYTVTLTVASAGCTSPGCLRSTSKLVQVRGDAVGANGCSGDLSDDPDKLCLGDGRYIVEVDWENHHVGDTVPHPTGFGQVRRLSGSENTGFFWFFNPDSIDLIVKIIDGTVVNDHVWVFYGALTDVIYDLKVTDTLTGKTKAYRNLANSICGRGDTAAFPMEGFTAPATAAVSDAAVVADGAVSEELRLLGGRFKVTVEWANQHGVPEGQPRPRGVGKSITGTDGSGYFYFFEPSSLDLVVKMIDATSFDGHYWVFYGGLSDVEYTLHVEDTVTGERWERVNPAGSICGGSDTAAFSILGD